MMRSIGRRNVRDIIIPTPNETRVKYSLAGFRFTVPIIAGGLNSTRMRVTIANQNKLSG